jgi:23S rRNA pseudouridine2605 synthase
MDTSEPIRLNKHIALQLGISRREADNLIEKGRVVVNNKTAVLGGRIVLADAVTVNGKVLPTNTKYQYILLHKPVGYVCSRRAQGSIPTIYSLLPPKLHHLKPVGRLDKDSSGLILLSNDGDFAYRMTHPKFHKIKVYEATLNHELEPLHHQMINDYGIQLEDGTSKLVLGRLSDTNRLQWQVTMHEGRNRQIRRTFAALGYAVTKLHRTQFGAYTLNATLPGKFIAVSPL